MVVDDVYSRKWLFIIFALRGEYFVFHRRHVFELSTRQRLPAISMTLLSS